MVNFYKLNLILEEEKDSVLIPRRSSQERQKNYILAIQRQIQQYIKKGSVGDLDLSETPITILPNNLKVGGSLDLGNTPITYLPKNLKVGGSLFLSYTNITNLPDNLKVGRDLYLRYTPITSLPKNLTVGGDLHLNKTPILKKYTTQQLKDMLPGVKGSIYG